MTRSEPPADPPVSPMSPEASGRPVRAAPVPIAILHTPHASRRVPDAERALMLISDAALEDELLRMTDASTDELFRVDPLLATELVFPVSRLVVDVERFGDDTMEPMAKQGMGAIYSRTSRGETLRHLDFESRMRLIRKYYLPHHFRFAAMVDAVLDQHGRCLVVDGHSFASRSLPHESDQRPDRPQICIGTDAFHTGAELRSRAIQIFSEAGFHTGIDTPFAGTIVPIKHFGRDPRVQSIMIEVNRALYMDESTGEHLPDFNQFCNRFRKALQSLISNPA